MIQAVGKNKKFCAGILEVLKVQVKAELNLLIKEIQGTPLFILQNIICVFKPFHRRILLDNV